ncbi:hypothetical protein [Halorientalis litorea]|uniref:hypothetical protein n=1 Tax=Halorientalis litorea TaxID=2931977 RepID=UPI001FF1D534|nr:hypothetical protein [Halorientalis litorea]
MERRTKRSLLWGVVGALSFLVLLQGYELVTGEFVDVPVKFGTALAVLVGATALTYRVEGCPPDPNERT